MSLDRTRFGSWSFRLPVLFALAATPVLADHAKDVWTAISGLRSNNLGAADKVFLKDASKDGSDRLLSLYELGSIYHLAGNPKKSTEFFNTADQVAHDYEGQAVISAGQAARTAGAVLVNDSMLKYMGFGYEKVMSRTINALNYLFLGDMEGARVEVRKAEEYQRLEREKHQKEIQKAGERQPKGAEAARMDNPAVQANYGKMFDSVKNIRNSFENAFTYYLSSQIYLAQGPDGVDDALVEIKRAYELAPQAPEVRSSYLEIARAQSPGALEEAKRRLGTSDPGPQPGPGGSVVVVFETGLVPVLDEVKISLVALNKAYSLAFPIYREFQAIQPTLTVATPAGGGSTSRVLDTRGLAVKSLEERMPGILTRGLLGAMAKGEVQDEASKNFGFFGSLISKVASVALTSADRRSWLGLPAEVQVARFNLAPGRQVITLQGPGLGGETVNLNVTSGSHSFVLVRAFTGFKRVDVKTFGPGGSEAPEAEGATGSDPAVSAPNL
jgi:hypothetical protein